MIVLIFSQLDEVTTEIVTEDGKLSVNGKDE